MAHSLIPEGGIGSWRKSFQLTNKTPKTKGNSFRTPLELQSSHPYSHDVYSPCPFPCPLDAEHEIQQVWWGEVSLPFLLPHVSVPGFRRCGRVLRIPFHLLPLCVLISPFAWDEDPNLSEDLGFGSTHFLPPFAAEFLSKEKASERRRGGFELYSTRTRRLAGGVGWSLRERMEEWKEYGKRRKREDNGTLCICGF